MFSRHQFLCQILVNRRHRPVMDLLIWLIDVDHCKRAAKGSSDDVTDLLIGMRKGQRRIVAAKDGPIFPDVLKSCLRDRYKAAISNRKLRRKTQRSRIVAPLGERGRVPLLVEHVGDDTAGKLILRCHAWPSIAKKPDAEPLCDYILSARARRH